MLSNLFKLINSPVHFFKTACQRRGRSASTGCRGLIHQRIFLCPPAEQQVVIADVPEVVPDHFNVRVDNHIPTIWGQTARGLLGESTYCEYELVNYFRQFDLSVTVDESTIAADLKHGVLTLTLSKVAEAQPRKIAVAVS
jgi:HSP20 family molecular chaperone IbpA